VGFEPSVEYSIEKAGNLKSMIFGGEGIFLATLKGTGKVWLQSMPIRKLIQQIAPMGGNSGKGASSILGSFMES
ncbi:MAG: TIGR00266 family protein, partial [Candidatus Zixiibacteriota bacterium]